MVLRRLIELGDVLFEAIVAASGVGEHVAVDPARVRQQVPHRHLLRHLGVGEPELGKHVDDRRVEIELPLVDELHHDRRSPHLGHRADLEHGVRRHLDAGLLVQHTGGRLDDVVLTPRAHAHDPERRARHAVPLGQHFEALLPVGGVEGDAPVAGVLLDPVDDAVAQIDPV